MNKLDKRHFRAAHRTPTSEVAADVRRLLIQTRNLKFRTRNRIRLSLSRRLLFNPAIATRLLFAGLALPGADAPHPGMERDGWTGAAQREEIRPAFVFKKNGGPNRHGSLIIRADDREGLDGHWVKAFPIVGGQ